MPGTWFIKARRKRTPQAPALKELPTCLGRGDTTRLKSRIETKSFDPIQLGGRGKALLEGVACGRDRKEGARAVP